MTLPKQAIQRIVELWGVGASAEETVQKLRSENYRISIATVYRKRHSITAQQMIDELIRKQLCDIAVAEGEVKLRWRDKLLEKLIPQRIEALTLEKREINVNATVTNIDACLRDYEWALEEATRLNLQSNSKTKPVDTPQATPEANTVPAA